MPVFFARPYRSTDKPHIEYLNKFVWQYIPKGKSFKDLTKKDIIEIEKQLNNRPWKALNFLTPFEVFFLRYAV